SSPAVLAHSHQFQIAFPAQQLRHVPACPAFSLKERLINHGAAFVGRAGCGKGLREVGAEKCAEHPRVQFLKHVQSDTELLQSGIGTAPFDPPHPSPPTSVPTIPTPLHL